MENKITVNVTGDSSVIVIRKSVVDMDTDAIVNAANCSLLGGGGVDGAIHRAAGPELLEECRKLGGCNTGDAKITKGYNLKSRFVIHTVGPVYSGTSRDAALLLSCYRKSLDIAYDSGLESVSFPCISTGVYGYPLDEACRIAFDTVCDTLRTYNRKMTVYLCCFSDREFETFSLSVR